MKMFFEVLLEGAYGFVLNVCGDSKKAKKIFPLVFTLFIFIIVANLATYIPGQASLSINNTEESVPVFRAVMSDYGMVFVMTMLVIFLTQIVAIFTIGPFAYIFKFINLPALKNSLLAIFRKNLKFTERLGVIAQGFLDFFLSLMELVGEIAKVISLSFRLFGNIFAGEVLTAVMLFIGMSVINFSFLKISFLADGLQIIATSLIMMPFMFLGLLTAVVQAFVFSVLTLIFLTMASEKVVEAEVTD
jgi:F-type H+-transporting ATPase subunit a